VVLEHLNETIRSGRVGEEVDDCIFGFMWGNANDGIGQVQDQAEYRIKKRRSSVILMSASSITLHLLPASSTTKSSNLFWSGAVQHTVESPNSNHWILKYCLLIKYISSTTAIMNTYNAK